MIQIPCNYLFFRETIKLNPATRRVSKEIPQYPVACVEVDTKQGGDVGKVSAVLVFVVILVFQWCASNLTSEIVSK